MSQRQRTCNLLDKANGSLTNIILKRQPNSTFIGSWIWVRRQSKTTSYFPFSFPNPFRLLIGLFRSKKDGIEEQLEFQETETREIRKTSRLVDDDAARLKRSGNSVASIQSRATTLLNLLEQTHSDRSRLIRLEAIVEHLKTYPIARQQLLKDNGIASLLTVREQTKDDLVRRSTRIALTLLGFVEPIKENGIRILALDGGGTRGVISIEILKKFEDMCNKQIHEMFDLVVGTSTGAILAFLIAVKKTPLTDALKLYERLSTEIFERNTVLGAGKLFLTHAYYDTEILEDILRQELGDCSLIDTAADPSTPKIAAVSSLVNRVVLQPYVFRNYSIPFIKQNHPIMGSSRHKLWEAVRASSAAPGFFEEFKLEDDIHQDGGLLANNPTALAIHEAKTLWPTTPIQCVISIGTGMYHGRSGPHTANFTSLQAKLMKVVASATDVEAIHTILEDLLPPTTYFRFNPNMSVDVPLDACDPLILEQLQVDTRNYITKFSPKFDKSAKALLTPKSFTQNWKEKMEYKRIMRQ